MMDVAIIGGGVAGLSAAMYLGRLGLKAVVFDAKLGGTITLTNVVENYPGFVKLTGQQLSDKLKEHAMVFKPRFINANVKKISNKKNCFSLFTDKNKYDVKAVILATGTKWRKLNVLGEKEFEKKGVHNCALCDGPFYKNKVVAVIGGADSAVKESLQLSGIAKKVYIIYRGDKLHPEPINLKRMKNLKNIEVIYNANVKEIIGSKVVEKVKLDDGKELKLDGIFVDIGQIPLNELAKSLNVKLNKNGEVIADKLMQTNLNGFFVAGDISDTPFKQAITAASEGCTAAYSVYQYVSNNKLCTYDEEPLKEVKK